MGRISAAQKVAERNRSTLSGVTDILREPCGGDADDTGVVRVGIRDRVEGGVEVVRMEMHLDRATGFAGHPAIGIGVMKESICALFAESSPTGAYARCSGHRRARTL